MLDARLKVLGISGHGDIRDAMWELAFCASPRFELARMQRSRVMRKAYLAKYLNQAISTWDDMSRTEIEEWIDACSVIMEAEAKNESIPL